MRSVLIGVNRDDAQVLQVQGLAPQGDVSGEVYIEAQIEDQHDRTGLAATHDPSWNTVGCTPCQSWR